MVNEDAVKMALVQVHAMLDKVQSNGDEVIAYWVSVKEGHATDQDRNTIRWSMEKLGEDSLALVTKASVLSSALISLLENTREKNAVVQNALKALSQAYAKLLRIQECLAEVPW